MCVKEVIVKNLLYRFCTTFFASKFQDKNVALFIEVLFMGFCNVLSKCINLRCILLNINLIKGKISAYFTILET